MNDSICALSTAIGNAGIAIIRLSGSSIFQEVNEYFSAIDLEKSEANKVYFGHFLDSNKQKIDDVLLSVFHTPKSFTGENVIEISCHSNRIIIESILSTLHQSGIRLAEAGEFTKRAFLNDKMDLSQAEAVADLISATNKHAVTNALRILDGKLSKIVSKMREKMIQTAGLLEIDLDFSEDDLDIVDMKTVKKYINESIDLIHSFIKQSSEQRFIIDGIRLAIVGKANAGKSSVLNLLLGKERAIVSDIEGTTRDTVEETINLNGLTVRLIDTAGIRQSNDEIEKIGVSMSYKAIENSDCVILLIDSEKGFSDDDQGILDYAKHYDKKVIIAFNKSDLKSLDLSKYTDAIAISAKTGDALEQLKEKIESFFQIEQLEADENIIVSNLRHELALKETALFLEQAKTAIHHGLGNEIISIDIRQAIEELSKVTGQISTNDILNTVFSNFCIGK